MRGAPRATPRQGAKGGAKGGGIGGQTAPGKKSMILTSSSTRPGVQRSPKPASKKEPAGQGQGKGRKKDKKDVLNDPDQEEGMDLDDSEVCSC